MSHSEITDKDEAWPFASVNAADFYALPLDERQAIERRVAEIMREMLGSTAREQEKPEET